MLFKKMRYTNNYSAHKATFITFVFWGLFILSMSMYGIWFEETMLNIHTLFLIIGLLLFFTTNYISNRGNRSK